MAKKRKAEGIILAYITCPSPAVAKKLGERIVKERLAACSNVLPSMESCYHWEGKIEHSREAVLILKTTRRHKKSLLQRIKLNHPYQVPCVLFINIAGGNSDYLNWLASNVRPALK